MCYKRPGPRCSSHAKKELTKAESGYDTALASNDPELCISAKATLEEAKAEYYMTPKGQDYLKECIVRTGDPNGELQFQLEYAQMAREDALSQLSHQDKITGDNHANERIEGRKNKLDQKFAAKERGIRRDEENKELAQRIVLRNPNQSNFRNLTLDDPASGYADYSSHLIPQADDLEKISSVVDAVERGAITSSAIAESIRKTDRQGNYYGNAAEYIGLVRKSGGMDGAHEYELTENGEVFRDAEPKVRAAMMRELVNSTPVMKAYLETGRDKNALEEYIRESGDGGYQDSVVKRRTASIVNWDKKLNSDSFVSEIGASSRSTSALAVVAAERLKAEREAKAQLNKKPEVKDYGTCMKCFTKLPASGHCDCDD